MILSKKSISFKNFTVFLLILIFGLIVFTSCDDKKGINSEVSSAEESSVSSQDNSSEDAVMTVDRLINSFIAALSSSDTTEIEKLSGAEKGTYKDWKTMIVTECRLVKEIIKEDENSYGVFEISLNLESAGGSPFAKGANTYYVEIMRNMFTDGPVIQLIKKDKYVEQDKIRASMPAQFVSEIRGLGITAFNSPSDIDKNRMLSFLIYKSCNDNSNKKDQPLESVNQQQLNTTAQRYFGLEAFEATDSAEYDPETQMYMLLGRGASYINDRIVSIKPYSTDTITVVVEEYSDALQTRISRSIRYTLKANGDGSYRVLSGIAF